jgi:hypothetical protein
MEFSPSMDSLSGGEINEMLILFFWAQRVSEAAMKYSVIVFFIPLNWLIFFIPQTKSTDGLFSSTKYRFGVTSYFRRPGVGGVILDGRISLPFFGHE